MMMKKILLLAALSLVAASLATADGIDFDYFYNELAPYGDWVEVAPYGWVWTPGDVGVDWKPYQQGGWVYTDYGWTFDSDEPWAWAAYHYGRWTFNDDYGWIWVPGTEWGPAWVAWRSGDGCVGWAPLPPAVGWSAARGLVVGTFNLETGIDWTWWIFVEPRWFTAPSVRIHVLPPFRNVEYVRRSRNITRYTFANRRVFNTGFPIRDAERYSGRKIARVRIVDAGRGGGGRPVNGKLPVFKPTVTNKRTVIPRDLPDKRRPVSADEVRRKQEKENRQFTDYFDGRKREIQPPPDNKGRTRAGSDRRVADDETKRLNELRARDKRVLDNRQKRELEKLKKKPEKNNRR